MAKLPSLQVLVPKKLLNAAKSSARPSDTSESGSEIANRTTYEILNSSVRNYRTSQNIVELIRHLARSEGPFATAIHNMVETAATPFTVMAYDAKTHQFSAEGTSLAHSILASFDTLYDFTEGFSQKKSMATTTKMLIREAALTGGVSAELVLNKARLPEAIQAIGTETLTWISNGKGGAYPGQKKGGDTVPLNIPTFWVDYVQADPGMVYARSMMEASIKTLIYFEEFMEDIRRSVRQSGHNRTTFTLDSEKIKKTAPLETQNDPKALQTYFITVRDAIQTQLESIEPEQALVMYDSAKAGVIESGMGTKLDYTPLLSTISGLYATSMKTPPSVLGLRLESGSQALGNVETLIFLKSVAALHTPVETILTRALTLSARLYGADVYVKFKFDPVDLRPDMELEAFKTMKQTRTLELLFLGFISDDEAAAILKTGPRAPNAPLLSGTMLNMTKKESDTTSPGDTAMGRTLQPDKDVPRKAGGKSQ